MKLGKYPVIYTVELVNESDYNKPFVEKGLIYADNHAEAVADIEEYYGFADIISIKVEVLEEGFFVIDEANIKYLQKELNIHEPEL